MPYFIQCIQVDKGIAVVCFIAVLAVEQINSLSHLSYTNNRRLLSCVFPSNQQFN